MSSPAPLLHRRDCLLLLAGCLGLGGCAALRGDGPGGGRPRPTAAGLRAAARYSGSRGERALIVEGSGIPRISRGDRSRPWPVYSITKTLGALAVLSAVEAGELSLDQPAWAQAGWGSSGDARDAITPRQLLAQSSGLQTGVSRLYRARPADLRAAAREVPPEAAPGSRFEYGPSHYELLAALLDARLSGAWSADRWLDQQVIARLGLRPGGDWRQDRRGRRYWSTGIELSGHDLHRLGRWLTGAGLAVGGPPVGAGLKSQAFAAGPGAPIYGLGVWRNASAGLGYEVDSEAAIGRLAPDAWRRASLGTRADPALLACIGSGGSRIYFTADGSLLAVRVGAGNSFRDPEFLDALYG